MKIFKKLMAAVSAIAMVATISSAMVVQASSTNPVITISKEAVAGAENTYNVTVSADTTNCANGTSIFQMTVKLPLPSTVFTNVADIVSDFAFSETDFTDVCNDPAYNDGELVMGMAVTTSRKAVDASGGVELFTINGLVMADDVAEDYDLTVSYLVMNVGESSDACIDYAYNTVGSVAMTADEFNTITFDATAAPAVTNVTPAKVGEYKSDNDETEKAVAYTILVPKAVGNSMTVTGTATKADATTEAMSKTYTVAVTEASVNYGIVISYNTANYSSVVLSNAAVSTVE